MRIAVEDLAAAMPSISATLNERYDFLRVEHYSGLHAREKGSDVVLCGRRAEKTFPGHHTDRPCRPCANEVREQTGIGAVL